ncbi:MAG: septal ring lytic transglycosylase RlpA family protein [bacterium]
MTATSAGTARAGIARHARPPAPAARSWLVMALLFSSCLPVSTGCALRKGPERIPDAGPGYLERGIASWYGREFHKRKTASGEPYDQYAMTAAHPTLPMGTRVTVTDLETARSVQVRINDRGPFKKGRILDLSYGAASELGILQNGTALVEIRCPYSQTALEKELGYWVQVGAYRERQGAEGTATVLKGTYPGVQVFSDDSLYRVRVGPYRREEEAARTCSRLRSEGNTAYVVRDLVPLRTR